MSSYLERGSPEYRSLFDGFEHTAYRLETLQCYRDDDEAEALRSFLAGEPPGPYPGKDRWTARVRAAVAVGKVMHRVHIIAEPLTDYLRYEIYWSYSLNVAVGEDIRILPIPAGQWPAGLPREDYWLFDSRTLARMHYDDSGRMARIELDDDPAAVVQASAWRDAALHAATPYRDYLSRREGQLQHAS